MDALEAKFGPLVDKSVQDPCRLCRVPGTTNRRGRATPTRPFRQCKLIDTPERTGELVTVELIREATAVLRKESENPLTTKVHPSADDCDRTTAIDALNHLSPVRAANYDDWLKVGMALHNVGDDMLQHWDTWSRSCPEKYDEGVCAEKWGTFTRSESGIGIGSLLMWAKQDTGWSPSRRGRAVPPPTQDAPQSANPRTPSCRLSPTTSAGGMIPHFAE